MSNRILRFKNMTVPRQPGELARFRVLGGPDAGTVFVALTNRVSIGRDESNEIVLTDLKTSRKHAEVTLTASGVAMLNDAGSSNGVLVNGVQQFKGQLRTGDKIGLGTTVIEFIGAERGGTQILTKAPPTAYAVGGMDSGLTQFIQKAAEIAKTPPALEAWNPTPQTGSITKPAVKPSVIEKNKNFVLALAALTMLAMFLPEVEKKQNAKKNQYVDPLAAEINRSISSLAPPVIDKEAKRQADILYEEGFREFREGNYLRAEVDFETSLQIYPDHPLSKEYLETVKKTMADEARDRLKLGRREQDANRFPASFSYYDSVRRMYFRDQSNPLYKEAEKNIEDLQKKEKEWDE